MYNIGNAGKTASMSMLTLFESRRTSTCTLKLIQLRTLCHSQENSKNAFRYFVLILMCDLGNSMYSSSIRTGKYFSFLKNNRISATNILGSFIPLSDTLILH